MSRTVFVNPSFENPRRRRKGKKRRGRRSYGRRRSHKRSRKPAFRGSIVLRRNAGITPFVQNPLILSNPRRRRRVRRSNPLAIPSLKSALDTLMAGGGGASVALAVNMMGTSRIDNPWLRRGAQAGAAVIGGGLLAGKSQNLGAAFTGAMMMPLMQDLAADLLGIGVAAGVTAKEADLDALAADLEDVLDDMSDEDSFDLSDDDDEEEAW